jgi:hypothetical protein
MGFALDLHLVKSNPMYIICIPEIQTPNLLI